MNVRALHRADGPWAAALVSAHFGSPRVVSRGRLHDTGTLPGFVADVAGSPRGLLLYHSDGDQMEVVALIAAERRRGIGRALMQAMRVHAESAGAARLWLVTTNDNAAARAFYQAIGMRQAAVHRGAVAQARRLKPELPERNANGVPIEDEIELEWPLAADVTIRPYEATDAQALLEAVRESMAELSPWMPWCHPAYGLADARGFIDQAIAGRRDGTSYDFAIVARGQLAGSCGINHVDVQNRVANLGYWVRTTRAGQGITPRAVGQLIHWTLTHTNLNRIEIVAAVGNRRSQRVAEKVGAHRDGVLGMRTMTAAGPSDAVLYSVLRER